MFISTRSNKIVDSQTAIIEGLSSDGGLYIPTSIPSYKLTNEDLNLDYISVAKKILGLYFDDFTSSEIDYVATNSYSKANFKEKICDVRLVGKKAYLELFHGPTLAFKDMALTCLPYLMEVSLKKKGINKKVTILTATSGDTGGACLSGFSKSKLIDIVVLYPNNGVSPFQEKQMLSFTNENAKAFSLNGNFDDCQRIVKEIFNTYHSNSEVMLSSANSINIGRLVPQIIYYYYSYIKLVNMNYLSLNEPLEVSVPTGNFGNILACYLAKCMGLPISTIHCASNSNNVLTDFFNSGTYDRNRTFYKTISPSMDILISSNLERFLALNGCSQDEVNDYMTKLNQTGKYTVRKEVFDKFSCINAYFATEDEIKEEIKNVYENYNYIIDPHTAVSSMVKTNNKCLVVSTASPLKFSESVIEAIECDSLVDELKRLNNNIPSQYFDILKCEKPSVIFDKQDVINHLFKKPHHIKVSASTANLGVLFDCCGLSLDLYNTYMFYESSKYKLVNFDKRYIDKNNNLIIKSYESIFEALNIPIKPIYLEAIDEQIPTCRGLGSSSSCIVCGCLIAKHVIKDVSDEVLIREMIKLEGHPDNVVPCYLGGLVSSYKCDDNNYKYISYKCDNNLKFHLYIPNFELKTSLSRSVLPEKLSYSDAIYNISRACHMFKALENGDLDLLYDLCDDKIHQPYRLGLIKNGDKIFAQAKKLHLPVLISGAGPTLLIISKDDVNPIDSETFGFKHICLKPNLKKCEVE